MLNPFLLSEQAEWADRLRSGNETAFADIYRHYWSSLYAAAYNHVRSRDVAEELVQELFATLWLKRDRLTIQTSLTGYLHTTLRHQIYDYFDKQTVRQRVHEDLFLHHERSSYTTDQAVAYDELQTHLADAVGQLPQPAQTVFRLSRYDHLSTQAIAGQLALSPKMVEYHLTRALKLLRGQLNELIALVLLLTPLLRH